MGRPVGSVNKPRRQLLSLLQEKFPKYNAVLDMAEHAHAISKVAWQTNEVADHKAASDAHNAVAKYIYPALKAIEVQDEDGNPVVPVVSVKFGD